MALLDWFMLFSRPHLSGCEMLCVFFHSQELLELGIIPKEDCVLQMVRNSSFFGFFTTVSFIKMYLV